MYSRLPNPPGGFRTQAEWQTWQNSPEFRKAQREQRQYAFSLAPDGSFRVEDVPAGTYDVNVMVLEVEQRENSRSTRSIGSASKQIIVPPMPGGRSDEPLDIGTIEVRLQR